ncbi:hypothetical protein [Streptomyces sp. NPDC059788]|uniref:hypothetical protein n=1 Tax=Streptomyces sp. NPDC059788 TaxID=3346948 RepID=UPI00364ACD66
MDDVHIADRTDWRDYWREASEDDYVGELTTEIVGVGEDSREPVGTLALACAGAEAAENLSRALSHEWAVYTPEQAATVASAVYAQIEASAANLRALADVLGPVAARGDLEAPEPAVALLRKAADELGAHVQRTAGPVTDALSALPSDLSLPDSVHETVAAVAVLTGGELVVPHEPDDFDPEDDTFGCGCSVHLKHAGEAYDFHRGDAEWSLTKESDGVARPNGSMAWTDWVSFAASEPCAHPKQLAAEIKEALARDSA